MKRVALSALLMGKEKGVERAPLKVLASAPEMEEWKSLIQNISFQWLGGGRATLPSVWYLYLPSDCLDCALLCRFEDAGGDPRPHTLRRTVGLCSRKHLPLFSSIAAGCVQDVSTSLESDGRWVLEYEETSPSWGGGWESQYLQPGQPRSYELSIGGDSVPPPGPGPRPVRITVSEETRDEIPPSPPPGTLRPKDQASCSKWKERFCWTLLCVAVGVGAWQAGSLSRGGEIQDLSSQVGEKDVALSQVVVERDELKAANGDSDKRMKQLETQINESNARWKQLKDLLAKVNALVAETNAGLEEGGSDRGQRVEDLKKVKDDSPKEKDELPERVKQSGAAPLGHDRDTGKVPSHESRNDTEKQSPTAESVKDPDASTAKAGEKASDKSTGNAETKEAKAGTGTPSSSSTAGEKTTSSKASSSASQKVEAGKTTAEKQTSEAGEWESTRTRS